MKGVWEQLELSARDCFTIVKELGNEIAQAEHNQGTLKGLQQAIVVYCQENKIFLDNLQALGCDGTVD